eukprot:GEMP01054380.1.p1 GENE.GEMP01054380.1~~GEMP01054380.1.p1  ORF type:complete len:226 (+),score=48.63 GEMP01054380.1:211-888(+)
MFEIKKMPGDADEDFTTVLRHRRSKMMTPTTDGTKRLVGQMQNDLDLQRNIMSFQSAHVAEERKSAEEYRRLFLKSGERSLKYADMAKIATKGNRLHDVAFFGNLEQVKDFIESQRYDVNCVNGDLDTPLDLARKGKHLHNKAGHSKATADHDGVVSYLSQLHALTYEEVVVKRKEQVEREMERDKQIGQWKTYFILAATILFIVLPLCLRPGETNGRGSILEDL